MGFIDPYNASVIKTPKPLESVSKPKTLVTCSDQRIAGQTENCIPNRSPASKRCVSTHIFEKAPTRLKEHSKQGNTHHCADEKMYYYWFSSESGPIREYHNRCPHQKAGKGGHRIARSEQPDYHRNNDAVNEQQAASVFDCPVTVHS